MPITVDHKNQAQLLLDQLVELREEIMTACEEDEDQPEDADYLDYLDGAVDDLERFCKE